MLLRFPAEDVQRRLLDIDVLVFFHQGRYPVPTVLGRRVAMIPAGSMPEPLPLPHRYYRRFVNKKTRRLSPRFFFDGAGEMREPLRQALEARGYEDVPSIFLAWTPFIIGVQHLEAAAEDWFERSVEWLSANADDCWHLWTARIGDKPQTVIGFRSARDAALFKLFCA